MDYSQTIYEAITYIENHLYEEDIYHNVYKHVHISRYHFHRIFLSCTMSTIGTYVKKRRFTEMAERLRSTKDRITDIAFDCGYESHEAFSRAFKGYFGMTPHAYRKQEDVNPLLLMPPMDMSLLKTIGTSYQYEPVISHLETIQLYGFAFETTLQDLQIATNFEKLKTHITKHPVFTSDTFGYLVWVGDDNEEGEKKGPVSLRNLNHYKAMVGLSVTEGDKDCLTSYPVFGGLYATFHIQNDFKHIYAMYRYIYFGWLPKSGYKLSHQPVVERYSNDYSYDNNEGTMWLMIPIEKEQ